MNESQSRSDGAPERIYLQHDPEETGEPFNEAREVTWCKDKINSTDIEYVRADAVSERPFSFSEAALQVAPELRLSGISEIAIERLRQIEKEGWTAEHDEQHPDRELTRAAACYLAHVIDRQWVYRPNNEHAYNAEDAPNEWPWDIKWWKPKNPRRDLVRAAALIAAELDRMERKDMSSSERNSGS